MARNDVVLLDGIIDQRLAESLPSGERDEVFEFLVLEEMLKDYDLSRDQIDSGWIDGRDDGGIDGFFIFVNGHMIEDVDDFIWPRTDASLDVWIITCKHHATYRQATLDNIVATIQEVFDLGIPDSDLKGSYSDDLLALRNVFAAAYRRLSIGRPIVRFHVVYASRGDSKDVGESVIARSTQIEHLITGLFSSCSAHFEFVGASELVESHRRTKTYSLALPFLEHLATGQDSYVLLVRLTDYWKFVSDDAGNLRRYLFDSNVRDFLGETTVNGDIAGSLVDEGAPDFWWLNNGVTILATNATVPGKTIHLQNIQIVNGLQTTETIHRHFSSGAVTSSDRSLLVKIIVSSDAEARDRIIRATNNQTPVEVAALHATDKIQKDIEAILERSGWYYERRRNYYRNIGKPTAQFVSPPYLASAVVALILKNPGLATRLKPKFMRTQAGYESVFSAKLPIEVWPVLVTVFKAAESGLAQVRHPHTRGERFVRTWRPLMSLLVVAKRLGTFDFGPSRLEELSNGGPITAAEVDEAWEVTQRIQAGFNHAARIRPSFVLACCEEMAQTYSLDGIEAVNRRGIESYTPGRSSLFTVEFLAQVNAMLPPQPWKPGVHYAVARSINRPPRDVTSAIQVLIANGSRLAQRDGIVYDAEGRIVAVDAERVVQSERESDPPPGL